MNKFHIEYQYQAYLKRVQISEDQMDEFQRVEMRRAFHAGFAACFKLFRDDLTEAPEMMMNKIFDQINNDILTFWQTTGQKPGMN